MGYYKKIIFLGLFLSLLTLPSGGFAQTGLDKIQELRKQRLELNKKIEERKKEAEAKKKEAEELSKKIGQLNQDIEKTEKKIKETQIQIDKTNQEIIQVTNQIAEKERELAIQRENLAETLRTLYETSDRSNLEIIASASSLSDIIDHNEYLANLETKIEKTIKEITRLKNELEKKKKSLEEKKRELGRLENQQKAYQRGLEQEKQEKSSLLSSTKEVKKKLEEQIKEAKRMMADVNFELRRLEEAARKAAAERAQGARGRGVSAIGFQWPVDYIYISATLGVPTPFQEFHTGIDLVNIIGTPVYAAAGGVVTRMERLSYGYGIFVEVTHNDRFSTLYAHFLDFAPEIILGKQVGQGDLLGYIGVTGWTTGPHLHFEIREYGVPMDPLDYLP